MTVFRKDRHHGQSLVELALVMPLLLIILLITVDGARVFTAHLAIGNVAREGVNFGSRSSENAEDTSGIQAAALQELGGSGTIHGVAPTVNVQGPDACVDSGGYDCVRVTVNYTFRTLFSFPGLPDQIELSRSAQMRVLDI